jgi:hypothetical protein
MRNIFIITLFFLCFVTLRGQSSSYNPVRVENLSVQLSDDRILSVEMDIILPENFKVSSNRMVTFTPIIKGNDNQNYCRRFMCMAGNVRSYLNGTISYLMIRNSLFRRASGEEQVIAYTASLPSEDWMDKRNWC